jgi:hypothetical protein
MRKLLTMVCISLWIAGCTDVAPLDQNVAEKQPEHVVQQAGKTLPQNIIAYIDQDRLQVFEDVLTDTLVMNQQNGRVFFRDGKILFTPAETSIESLNSSFDGNVFTTSYEYIGLTNDIGNLLKRGDVERNYATNHITYTNDVFMAEYINNKTGIDQQFTIYENLGESFEILGRLNKGVRANLVNNTHVVLFEQDRAIMNIDNLHAWDANGKKLVAHFVIEGNNLNVHVSGVTKYPVFVDPTWTHGGDNCQAQTGLGYSFASGNFSNGSYDSIVVGAPYYSEVYAWVGKIYVWKGHPTDLNSDPEEEFMLSSPRQYGLFGYALASGQIGTDSYDDLAVGEVGYGDPSKSVSVPYEGRVHVMYGSDTSGSAYYSGLTMDDMDTINNPNDEDGDKFGHSVAIVDNLNNDSYGELVVGAPDTDGGSPFFPIPNAGKSYVFYGSSSGVDSTADKTWTGSYMNGHFGFAVEDVSTLCDSTYSTVAISGTGDTAKTTVTNAGVVHLYKGSSSGAPTSPSSFVWASDAAGGYKFGYDIAGKGDINGDGDVDLVVGSPGYDSSEGKIYVWEGSESCSGSGLGTEDDSKQARTTSSDDTQTGAQFGYAVAINFNFDNDDYDDVLIGAPYYDSGTNDVGRIYVWEGDTSLGTNATWIDTGDADLYNLGQAVEGIGKTDGDSYDDFAVGGGAYANNIHVHRGGASTPASADVHDLRCGYRNRIFGTSAAVVDPAYFDATPDYGYIVVGDSGYQTVAHSGGNFVGKVYVFKTGDDAVGDLYVSDWPVKTKIGDVTWQRFGDSVAVGDVNGDGDPDLVVGSPLTDWDTECDDQKVEVWYGFDTWLDASPDWTKTTDCEGFGTVVNAGGDVDNDGNDDLLIGRPGEDPLDDTGYVDLYLGDASGLSSTADWTGQEDGTYGDIYGESVAIIEDVTGDNYDDWLITDPYYSDHGIVYFYHGTATGSISGVTQSQTFGGASGDLCGTGISSNSGNMDNDGYMEFAIGCPGYSGDDGVARVFEWNGSSMTQRWQFPGDTDERLGCDSVFGNFDGNSYDDLAVSSTVWSAMVRVFEGGSPPNTTSDWEKATCDQLGHVMGTADFNDDGYDDLFLFASTCTSPYTYGYGAAYAGTSGGLEDGD